jgi:FAD synthase
MSNTEGSTILQGQTSRFKGDGRKLGYPTANLALDTDLMDGIYFGFADLADFKNQPAIIFIGTPTTMGDFRRRVEAYLLDIKDQDYYDLNLKLTVIHFHRPNKNFNSADELKDVMKQDEAAARAWFSSGSDQL